MYSLGDFIDQNSGFEILIFCLQSNESPAAISIFLEELPTIFPSSFLFNSNCISTVAL